MMESERTKSCPCLQKQLCIREFIIYCWGGGDLLKWGKEFLQTLGGGEYTRFSTKPLGTSIFHQNIHDTSIF